MYVETPLSFYSVISHLIMSVTETNIDFEVKIVKGQDKKLI